jgi:hypothetical protein
MNKNTIEIPRAWLERLIELQTDIENVAKYDDNRVAYFKGFIDASAKALLTQEK